MFLHKDIGCRETKGPRSLFYISWWRLGVSMETGNLPNLFDLSTSDLSPPDLMTRVPNSLTRPQQVGCWFLIANPWNQPKLKSIQNPAIFLDSGYFFQIPAIFSFKSVNFWHNKHRIWPKQWFLITICQKAHRILDGSSKISPDLVRSRCVSKHSDDNRVYPKPTTTRWQPEPTNPLLL